LVVHFLTTAHSEYFRVGFYGQRFQALAGKAFIFRVAFAAPSLARFPLLLCCFFPFVLRRFFFLFSFFVVALLVFFIGSVDAPLIFLLCCRFVSVWCVRACVCVCVDVCVCVCA
jgi:hypothetical protein